MLGSTWRKSTRSVLSNCLRAAWQCSGPYNDCVQAAFVDDAASPDQKTAQLYADMNVTFEGGCVLVSDSKLGAEGPVLQFTPAEWLAFLRDVRDADTFDLPPHALEDAQATLAAVTA